MFKLKLPKAFYPKSADVWLLVADRKAFNEYYSGEMSSGLNKKDRCQTKTPSLEQAVFYATEAEALKDIGHFRAIYPLDSSAIIFKARTLKEVTVGDEVAEGIILQQIEERKRFQKEPHLIGEYPIIGKVIILFYSFQTDQYKQFNRNYYVSEKGRFMFRYGPGLFDGMKSLRFGQFEYMKGVTAYMYTTARHYERDRGRFLLNVIRALKREKYSTNQK